MAGTHKESTRKATVLAVSENGIRTITGDAVLPSVAVGQEVLVENGHDLEVTVDGEKVSIIRESDIIAIVAE